MTASSIKTAFSKLTPNLIVADVERSLTFYTSVLGFERGFTVPEQSPFVFGSVVSGPIEIFFNERETATKEYPAFAGKPLGITGTMYIELAGRGNIERCTIV
jgi:catechol 2,3-dioxygenase-like lactoylglutathione lyase family enzyme